MRTFLALSNGIPPHDTFGRVERVEDPAQFKAGFRSWVAVVARRRWRPLTERRCAMRLMARKGRALVLVSTRAEENRLVLGQVGVDRGSNEIPAIPALLPYLALARCAVTVNASGCQAAIAAWQPPDAECVLVGQLA